MENAGVQGMMGGLGIASSGLSAQRLRIETIAHNIANAETTRTEVGGPYRRRTVRLAEIPFRDALRESGQGVPADRSGEAGGVRVAGVEADPTEGPLIYDPGHPDADTDGYVRMPNVDLTREMVDLMEARRLYEANASVFEAMKTMLSRSTRI